MSTYTPIASQTLTTNTATVVFAGIPQYYTDLILTINAGAATAEDIGMRFNDDTQTVYSNHVFAGNGSAVSAGTENNATSLAVTSNAYLRTTVANLVQIQICDYTNNAKFKTIQVTAGLGASGGGAVEMIAGLYRRIEPITQISLFGKNSGYNFLSGSTFNLYALSAGGAKAYGGDTVSTDGTYWYHTFINSGSFIPQQALTVDYLVVAGGGAGGREDYGSGIGGGGGAGGLRCTVGATGGGGSLESPLALTANTIYPVIVGAGGTYSIAGGRGSNGNNSTFASIVAFGGGGGAGGEGGGWTYKGQNGGSGGGGEGSTTSNVFGGGNSSTGGSGSANQGFAGGNSIGGSGGGTGGGGGAGEAGNTNGGAQGGDGVATSISGSSVTYAGGGGGASYGTAHAGGSGGGGTGCNYSTSAATDGTANTGGGGGGGGNDSSGGRNRSGAGGSGIVIVRYAV